MITLLLLGLIVLREGMSGKWLMCYTGNQVYRIDTTNVANIELVPNITYVSSTVWTYIVDDDIVINGWYFDRVGDGFCRRPLTPPDMRFRIRRFS